MALKELLVHLNQAAGVDRRLQLAMSLTDRHSCRLTAVFVNEWNDAQNAARATAELGLATSGVLDNLDRNVNSEINRVAARLWSELQGFHNARGLATEWHQVNGFCDVAVRRFAPLADLCILGHEGLCHGTSPDWVFCESMLLELGTPILYIPRATAATSLGSRILIAWDGSRAATRALSDALPLIDRSDHTLIVNVDCGSHEQTAASLKNLAERLRRHCSSTEFAQVQALPKSIAAVLQAKAGEIDADLIVSGAYGHSRLRQRIFGGVTRDLLERTRFPLLMSH